MLEKQDAASSGEHVVFSLHVFRMETRRAADKVIVRPSLVQVQMQRVE